MSPVKNAFLTDNESVELQKVELQFMTVEHIREVAAVHRLAFPESAWTKLGQKVVEKFYLSHLLRPHPVVHAISAFVNGRCVGFCISGVFEFRTTGFLSENRNLIASSIATKPWLLFDPMFLKKMRFGINALKRFNAKKRALPKQNAKPFQIDSFGVLAIAVSPHCQGLGIGKLLMENAQEKAAELGYKKMALTVNTNNLGGIRFYEKLNWQKHCSNEGWKGIMVKNL